MKVLDVLMAIMRSIAVYARLSELGAAPVVCIGAGSVAGILIAALFCAVYDMEKPKGKK